MRTWSFAKGHGTGNDFVILLDRTGMIDPDPAAVRYLCDRHAGIGGDGILRVVPGRFVADWSGDPELWFMDYRNADGSVAEMCGNGVRVFARYLLEQDLATGPLIPIGTRAGLRTVEVLPDARFRVDMGPVRVDDDADLPVGVPGVGPRTGRAADVGNPHLVVEVSPGELADAELHHRPEFPEGRFPAGVNLELTVTDPGRVRMRVWERGVGETQSCGTGTVAAAAVASARTAMSGRTVPTGAGTCRETWRVEVPGGVVEVELEPVADDGARRAWLTGPAVIVARGEVQVP